LLNRSLARFLNFSLALPSGMRARSVPPPVDCAAFLPGFDFADAYEIAAPEGVDAIEAARRAFEHPPRWATVLLDLRDRIVGLFGLKPAPKTGFPVISETEERVVMGFDDRHLDFRIVVTVNSGAATLTTIVRRHNALGRVYLALIMPFHRVIAAAFAERIDPPV
jgi:hypothetical protein